MRFDAWLHLLASQVLGTGTRVLSERGPRKKCRHCTPPNASAMDWGLELCPDLHSPLPPDSPHDAHESLHILWESRAPHPLPTAPICEGIPLTSSVLDVFHIRTELSL